MLPVERDRAPLPPMLAEHTSIACLCPGSEEEVTPTAYEYARTLQDYGLNRGVPPLDDSGHRTGGFCSCVSDQLHHFM